MPYLQGRRSSLAAEEDLRLVQIRNATQQRRSSAPAIFEHHHQPDDVLYFTDEYIEYLKKTGQRKLMILVSSWSESVIEHARSINLMPSFFSFNANKIW